MEQQLKELKGAEHISERARQKAALQWSVAKTRLEADQSVFKVYKGVKCFDFSKKKNIIITGGKCCVGLFRWVVPHDFFLLLPLIDEYTLVMGSV